MDTLRYILIRDREALEAQRSRFSSLFTLHRQLRPAMDDMTAYLAQINRVLDDDGQLLIALDQHGALAALALYRIHHNTYQHKLFFLEDLVVDEGRRDGGIGSVVLRKLEDMARDAGCYYLSLDSGTFRTRAHKFYYLNDYVADCFHFAKKL